LGRKRGKEIAKRKRGWKEKHKGERGRRKREEKREEEKEKRLKLVSIAPVWTNVDNKTVRAASVSIWCPNPDLRKGKSCSHRSGRQKKDEKGWKRNEKKRREGRGVKEEEEGDYILVIIGKYNPAVIPLTVIVVSLGRTFSMKDIAIIVAVDRLNQNPDPLRDSAQGVSKAPERRGSLLRGKADPAAVVFCRDGFQPGVDFDVCLMGRLDVDPIPPSSVSN